jgi:hypothetical protein
MAHPNIEERRAAVAQVLSYGIPLSREVRLALAEHFGCSETAITTDIRAAAALSHAVAAAQLQKAPSPCAAEKQSTYARLA